MLNGVAVAASIATRNQTLATGAQRPSPRRGFKSSHSDQGKMVSKGAKNTLTTHRDTHQKRARYAAGPLSCLPWQPVPDLDTRITPRASFSFIKSKHGSTGDQGADDDRRGDVVPGEPVRPEVSAAHRPGKTAMEAYCLLKQMLKEIQRF